MAQPNPDSRGTRKVRQGIVVSHKMTRSIIVRVDRTVRHPIYQKVIKRTKKYMAHCEDDTVKEGDVVRIMECRPLSRQKRWRLVEVVQRAEQVDKLPDTVTNPQI